MQVLDAALPSTNFRTSHDLVRVHLELINVLHGLEPIHGMLLRWRETQYEACNRTRFVAHINRSLDKATLLLLA